MTVGLWQGGVARGLCIFALALGLVLAATVCGEPDSVPDDSAPPHTGELDSVSDDSTPSYTGEPNCVPDTPGVEGSASDEAQAGDDEPLASESMLVPEFHGAGTASLEARIYDSDVVVRASFLSARNGVLRFRAVEYLKGTGATNFSVRATTDARNTGWDESEAVLFLTLPESGATTRSSESAPSEFLFTETDTYYTGQLPEGYTIDTRNPMWLPAESDATTRGTDGTSGSSAAFIIDLQSPLRVSYPTISLADLRAKIAWIEGGEDTAGYDDCIEYSLDYLTYYRDWETYYGREWEPYQTEKQLASGAEEGTVISDYGLYRSESAYGTFWLTGADASLFSSLIVDDEVASNGYGRVIATARPLPNGTYRFVSHVRGHEYFPCNFMPGDNRLLFVVAVTSPSETVHEAFFDPADLTPGVGFSTTSGVLKPATFSIGGTSTSITGLKWETGSVVMTLSPYVSLSGQTVDFIELDGSVGLSLPVSSATVDSTAGTLTWSVSEQPWEDGDQLMLRVGAAAPYIEPIATPAKQYPVDIEPAFPGLPPLKLPVALVDVPKHDLFLIALQDGLVLSVPRGGPYHNPRIVHDQRDRTLRYAYEEGFLALALDPSFDQNGFVYAYYSYSPGPEERSTRLVRFSTTGEGDTFAFDADIELVILEIPQPDWNHNGGSLVFGPDGMLYLGIGDGGGDGDPQGNGQNPGTLLGTVIRIDVRNASPEQPYSIPPDNPMISIDGARPEVWAYGLRNPWRLSFDAETRLLWGGDVGHYHAEEINIVRPGENYGWNITEGTSCFPQDQVCDLAGLTLPVWEYGRSSGCAVIGGYVYRGNEIPSLLGWYVFADYCTGRAWGIDAGNAPAGEPAESVLLTDRGPSFILSLAEDASGEIYILSGDEESNDRIYRVVPP